MKKVLISVVAAATFGGIAFADSNTTTELDLISVATQGAINEQSTEIVVLSAAEAAEVVGGYTIAGISTNRGLKPIGSIWSYTRGPLVGYKPPINASAKQ